MASTTAASFDGSANITPGVTGTLSIANGGTGAITAAAARTNLETIHSFPLNHGENSNTWIIFAKESEYTTVNGSWTAATYLIGGLGYPGN